MPFAILVEIESEEDAKALAADLVKEGYIGKGDGGLSVNWLPAKIRGAWRIPTKFCNPSDGHRRSGKIQGWSRGKKYGWWVCTDCGYPTEKWGTGGNWDYALGSNLIPQEITGEERIKGWRESPMQWTFLLNQEDDPR